MTKGIKSFSFIETSKAGNTPLLRIKISYKNPLDGNKISVTLNQVRQVNKNGPRKGPFKAGNPVSRILCLRCYSERRSFVLAIDCSQAHAAPPSCEGYGLAPSKDFAVSPPPSCPYSGVGPSTSGWGSSLGFRFGTSLLSPLFLRTSAVSGYYFIPTCVGMVSGLSSPPNK